MFGICIQFIAQISERSKTINLLPYEGSWEYSSNNADSIYFRVDLKRIRFIYEDQNSYSSRLCGYYLYRDQSRFESNIDRMPQTSDVLDSMFNDIIFTANRVYSIYTESWVGFDSSYVNLRFRDQLYKKPGEGRITWINDSTLHWQLEEPRDIVLLEEGSHDGPGFSVPTNVMLRRRKE